MDNLQTLLIAVVLMSVLLNFVTLVKVMQMANAQARREKRHQERNQNNGRNDNRGRDGKGGQNRPARTGEVTPSRGGRNDNRRRGNGNNNSGRGNNPQSNTDAPRAPQKKTEDYVEVAGGSLREINQMLKAKPLVEEKKEPQAPRNTNRNNTPRNAAPRSSENKSENTPASEAPVVARKPERPVGESVQKATQPAEIVAPKTVEVREAAPAPKESPVAAAPKSDKPVSYGRR